MMFRNCDFDSNIMTNKDAMPWDISRFPCQGFDFLCVCARYTEFVTMKSQLLNKFWRNLCNGSRAFCLRAFIQKFLHR